MLEEPKCSKRNCKHLEGVEWLGEEEATEIITCVAFPKGIPIEIAYGKDLHLTPRPDQGNDVAYEKDEEGE